MNEFLIFVPLLVYLLGALIIFILTRLKLRSGWIWLVALAAAFIPWVSLFFIPVRLLGPVNIQNWLPFADPQSDISFQLDPTAWPFAFALAGLILGVILTAPIRIKLQSEGQILMGTLAISAIGLLSIASNSLLALILTWTALDLTELIIMATSREGHQIELSAILSFAFRVLGSWIVMLVLILSQPGGLGEGFSHLEPRFLVFMVLAVGLRLGILPLHLPFTQEMPIRRGLGTVLRMVAPAASLVVLGRLPVGISENPLSTFFMIVSAFVAIYGSIMWATASDELAGRPYFLITLASFSVMNALHGQPEAAMFWGVILLLAGGVLFLFSYRSIWAIMVGGMGLIAFSGLPFTPTGSGWIGLFGEGPSSGLGYFFIISLAFLQFGYLRHILSSQKLSSENEPWVKLVFPLGLFAIVLTQWLVWVRYIPHEGIFNYWWAGVASLVLALSGMMVYGRTLHLGEKLASNWWISLFRSISSKLAQVLQLRWVFKLLSVLYSLVERFIGLIILVLEGEGGFLWALLLLAMMAALIQTGSVR